MPDKTLFVAVHHHDYGTSVYLFRYTPTEEQPVPPEREIVSRCDIDFEPDKEEWIDICEADEIVDLDEPSDED